MKEAMLERFTKEITIGNWWGTWKERTPVPGLSFYLAVEISRWCADKYADRCDPTQWFKIFDQRMGDAGYGFVNNRVAHCGLHFDRGLVVNH
jgi:hypothetical protein